MNDSDSEDDRFDLGDDSGASENEAMNDSEWEFESDEEQATGSTLPGSGKLTWNDMIMRVDVTPILAFLNKCFCIT